MRTATRSSWTNVPHSAAATSSRNTGRALGFSLLLDGIRRSGEPSMECLERLRGRMPVPRLPFAETRGRLAFDDSDVGVTVGRPAFDVP